MLVKINLHAQTILHVNGSLQEVQIHVNLTLVFHMLQVLIVNQFQALMEHPLQLVFLQMELVLKPVLVQSPMELIFATVSQHILTLGIKLIVNVKAVQHLLSPITVKMEQTMELAMEPIPQNLDTRYQLYHLGFWDSWPENDSIYIIRKNYY